MKKAYLVAGILALSLVMLSGCGDKKETEPEVVLEPGTAVTVQTVSLGNISTENNVSGTVVAGKTESAYVALSARISQVHVEQGDTVRAGAAICTLDLTTYYDNYELAQMNYDNAQRSHQDQSVLLDQQVVQLEKNYQDTLALFEIGAASQIQVDTAKLNLDSAVVSRTSALSQLETAMKNAQSSMKQITDSLNNVGAGGVVSAPVSGTIVSLSAAKDGMASPGMPLASIESSSDMKISVSVSEVLISKLKVGDKARVIVNALGEEYNSSIKEISKSANPQTHLYTVDLYIPQDAEGLLSGMFADITLYTDSRDNTVIVPTEAILVSESGQYVVILDQENLAHRVLVQTGLVGDGVTEILSGLSGGETLVTVGQSYLGEGDLARVVQAGG